MSGRETEDEATGSPAPGARLPAGALAALLLAGVAAGCGRGEAGANTPELETSTVERRTIESTVEATGTVEPIRRVEVKSQASGEILEMPLELGDEVERGALLARIDPRDEVNELEQARADLEQAEAQLSVAESRLERARALRDSGVVTAEELETAILEHANARSAHQRARTRLELAREQRADATVRAPISGTIIEKQVEEGQIITSTRDVTGGTTLLTMAELSEVQVRTLVDESDIGRVEAGLLAEITVEAYPSRTFRGRVLKIEPQATVEQNVTMFPVLTRIPNEEGLLRPGMNADVQIVVGREEDALALPNAGVKMPAEARRLAEALDLDPSLLEQEAPRPGGEAPSEEAAGAGAATAGAEGRTAGEAPGRSRQDDTPDRAFVFVRDAQGRLTLKPVLVGLSSFEHTEVVAGLAEGDTVVNVPLALVQQRQLLERIRSRSGVPGMGG